jgi:hypothetical protein
VIVFFPNEVCRKTFNKKWSPSILNTLNRHRIEQYNDKCGAKVRPWPTWFPNTAWLCREDDVLNDSRGIQCICHVLQAHKPQEKMVVEGKHAPGDWPLTQSSKGCGVWASH